MLFKLGDATRNALLNSGAKEEAYRQTQRQHDSYANKYVKPGMTPFRVMVAMAQGEQEERLNPRYWNDDRPRVVKGELSPSSTWIDSVEYLPDMGLSVIVTDNGRQYYYPKTARQVGNLVTSPSIGQWYDRNFKLK